MAPSSLKTTVAAAVGVIAVILLGLGLRSVYWPKVPTESLKTNQGRAVSLLDLQGKEIGVLLYFSAVPCQGHKDALGEILGTYEMLQKTARFRPFIMFGDQDEASATAFTQAIATPVLLDPGMRVARRLSIKNYAVVLFGADGTVRRQMDGIVLTPKPGLDDFLASKLQ